MGKPPQPRCRLQTEIHEEVRVLRMMDGAGVGMVRLFTDVHVNPDPTGLPGGQQLQKLLNGLVFVGLLACVAAIVAGGATWFVGSHSGNYSAAMGGRRAVMAGIVGALVIGAAAALVNFFFHAGSAVK